MINTNIPSSYNKSTKRNVTSDRLVTSNVLRKKNEYIEGPNEVVIARLSSVPNIPLLVNHSESSYATVSQLVSVSSTEYF
ncbi:MAG: hypothetical protein O6940_07215 [Ignavibacteria bacterium]|nr:hypothetical protein [Ignavibacteria bacterium]